MKDFGARQTPDFCSARCSFCPATVAAQISLLTALETFQRCGDGERRPGPGVAGQPLRSSSQVERPPLRSNDGYCACLLPGLGLPFLRGSTLDQRDDFALAHFEPVTAEHQENGAVRPGDCFRDQVGNTVPSSLSAPVRLGCSAANQTPCGTASSGSESESAEESAPLVRDDGRPQPGWDGSFDAACTRCERGRLRPGLASGRPARGSRSGGRRVRPGGRHCEQRLGKGPARPPGPAAPLTPTRQASNAVELARDSRSPGSPSPSDAVAVYWRARMPGPTSAGTESRFRPGVGGRGSARR